MRTILLACCVVLLVNLSLSKDEKVFRADYEYFVEADGWFKFHQMPQKWQGARLQCAYEGAMLASPSNYGLAAVLRSLAAKKHKSVYIGIHATVSPGDFHSLDGLPLSEIPIRWLDNNPDNENSNENCLIYTVEGKAADVDCNRPFPYVCYKKHSQELALTECGTTDKAYKLDLRTNKCYKFHRMGRAYSVAANICTAEGGHLAITNSEIEAEVLRNVFASNPADTIHAAFTDGARLGFYNWDDSNFFGTLHGQSIEEAGYAKWSPNQPDHLWQGRQQRCGNMYRDGTFDDYDCGLNAAFICEKHPDSLRISTIDIRFQK